MLNAHLVCVVFQWGSEGQLHPTDHCLYDKVSPRNQELVDQCLTTHGYLTIYYI